MNTIHIGKTQTYIDKFCLTIWTIILLGIISLFVTACSPTNENVEKVLSLPIEKHSGSLDIAFSSDSQMIASGSSDGNIYLWNGENGEQIRYFPHTGESIYGLAFSPDDRILGASTKSGIHFWRVRDGDLQQTVGEENIWPGKLVFSPDGELVAVHSGISVEVWQIADNTRIFQQEWSTQTFHKVIAFSPSGNLIAYSNGEIFIHNIKENIAITTIGTNVHNAAFSPDNRYLVTNSVREVSVWQLSEGLLINNFATEYMTAGIVSDKKIIAGLYYDQNLDPALSNENNPEVTGPKVVGFAVWNTETGDLLWRENQEDISRKDLFGGILSSDGTLFAARSIESGLYSVWRLKIPTVP